MPISPEALIERVDQLKDDEAQQLLIALKHKVIQACAHDGLQYLRFVSTKDEADPLNAVKMFPFGKLYTQEIWKALDRATVAVIAKSRQMILSWLVAAYCTWWARFKPHQAIYYQMQAYPDAVKMVCEAKGKPMGRSQFIEQHLPLWLRQPVREGEGIVSYPNGSFIQALAGGEKQVRGKTGSILVLDEFSAHEEARQEWTAVAPLLQKGAKIFVISTPNGRENQFGDLFFGFRVQRD